MALDCIIIPCFANGEHTLQIYLVRFLQIFCFVHLSILLFIFLFIFAKLAISSAYDIFEINFLRYSKDLSDLLVLHSLCSQIPLGSGRNT